MTNRPYDSESKARARINWPTKASKTATTSAEANQTLSRPKDGRRCWLLMESSNP